VLVKFQIQITKHTEQCWKILSTVETHCKNSDTAHFLLDLCTFPFLRTGGGRLIFRMLQCLTFMLKKYETFVLAFNMLCVRILFEILVEP